MSFNGFDDALKKAKEDKQKSKQPVILKSLHDVMNDVLMLSHSNFESIRNLKNRIQRKTIPAAELAKITANLKNRLEEKGIIDNGENLVVSMKLLEESELASFTARLLNRVQHVLINPEAGFPPQDVPLLAEAFTKYYLDIVSNSKEWNDKVVQEVAAQKKYSPPYSGSASTLLERLFSHATSMIPKTLRQAVKEQLIEHDDTCIEMDVHQKKLLRTALELLGVSVAQFNAVLELTEKSRIVLFQAKGSISSVDKNVFTRVMQMLFCLSDASRLYNIGMTEDKVTKLNDILLSFATYCSEQNIALDIMALPADLLLEAKEFMYDKQIKATSAVRSTEKSPSKKDLKRLKKEGF